jgi:hypothetical protein
VLLVWFCVLQVQESSEGRSKEKVRVECVLGSQCEEVPGNQCEEVPGNQCEVLRNCQVLGSCEEV